MISFRTRFLALLDEQEASHQIELEEAHRKGGEEMRESILRAAQSPISAPKPAVSNFAPSVAATPAVHRASRGSVEKAIDAALDQGGDGMTITEIEERALSFDKEISPKSVGNKLRYLEGKRYRRDRAGGYKWFRISQTVDPEGGWPATTAPASNVFDGTTKGHDNAAP
jgi:hypothetical protein